MLASTPGVYDKFQRFRAGIEAAISYFKRCFGLRRGHWRGLDITSGRARATPRLISWLDALRFGGCLASA